MYVGFSVLAFNHVPVPELLHCTEVKLEAPAVVMINCEPVQMVSSIPASAVGVSWMNNVFVSSNGATHGLSGYNVRVRMA